MQLEVFFKDGTNTGLTPVELYNDGNESLYNLVDKSNKILMVVKRTPNSLTVESYDDNLDIEYNSFADQLDRLFIDIVEAEQSGLEIESENDFEEINPFNPEDIKVHAKQFSLRLISDMIDDGDIDLSPDFQRNLVWNSSQKSRLIESILLRIPLPMFYFSEDDQGRITIVDGLQRLTTIKEFMQNEFPLKNLEYLTESCQGRYYKTEGNKIGIDPKYTRWFNQTQFSVNVIDPSSPSKVKYDIFRRINTGGKPLNNQEIRNCLAGKGLRATLNSMTNSTEFKSATCESIKSSRMEDHEVALRFILFSYFRNVYGTHEQYSGYIDAELDEITERLSPKKEEELTSYVDGFLNGMKNAEYLFGSKHAFRKVRLKDIEPDAYKKLINKALFVSWSVLLSQYDHEAIRSNNDEFSLLEPLATLIEEDETFMNYLSYGTNNRNNVLYTFEKCQEIIDENLTY